MKCARCSFENPPGFAFCGKCGAALAENDDRLANADIDHLRTYLPSPLVEALLLDPVSPSPRLIEQCLTRLSEQVNTVCIHLPPYLVERIWRDPVPGQAGGEFVRGALLFADISGFTAMSERLSRIGREGAEEITAIVNRYFEVMLSILNEHGGQLIEFGGDALLGLFLEPAGPDERERSSVRCAVQAALGMQAAMGDFAQTRTSQGLFSLQMKVGIHRGPFFAARLGSAHSMEYGLFGSGVNATAATEALASTGQVVLDRATLDALDALCVAVPLQGDDRYLAIQHIDAPRCAPAHANPPSRSLPAQATLDGLRHAIRLLDALTPYLPAGLLGRLSSETHAAGLEGEHRVVATLFANVQGLGAVVDRLGAGREADIVAALNRYFVAIQTAIHRFGGVINKIDLDERGDKLLALFGAPLAHEDDAERAVRAALAMQEALAGVTGAWPADDGLSQQIGISYGYVFAGYVGTTRRQEYTVMGDEVNLAARLMSIAQPGGVIVSNNVRRKVQALFELSPRSDAALKGKTQPVPVFSVEGARAVPEPVRGLSGMRSPLVARDTEWRELLAAMQRLGLGQGQIVSIVGEAGLGKSRLAAELQAHTPGSTDSPLDEPGPGRRSGVLWIEGRCLSYMESVSYFPFHEIVRKLTGIRADDNEIEAWNKLRQMAATRDASLADSTQDVSAALPYLAHFLGLPLDDEAQERVRFLDAEALQRRTFFAIRTLIESRAREAPVVLALDDIHWMDQASLALLEYLMPLVERAPLMLMLLYRPDRDAGSWRIHEKVAREFPHCATLIAVQRLTHADSRRLLVNLTGFDDWSPEMLDPILGRTEGNPLYLEEVLRTLIDEGILIKGSGGQWRMGDGPETLEVPDTLQGVMMARLDRLEEPCRRTAQVASVVGRAFSFDVLAHVVAENQAELNPWLVRLQQHEIVRESQRSPELVYTFKHSLMQEVCYNSLLARIRHHYHRQVAEYLASGRGESESDAALIAHHAYIGQDWPRALRFQMSAGHQAQKLFANLAAIDHFEKALESADKLPAAETIEPRQVIHTALGELLTVTGEYEAALEHLDSARLLAAGRGDRDAQARACRRLARLHELRSEYERALEWIERGLTLLDGRETSETVELRLIAGLIHSRRGDNDRALDECQNALRIAQHLGEITGLARAYNLLGHITRLLVVSTVAVEHFQQAFDLYQRAGDIQGQATSHNQIANACFDLGQWQEAEHHYRQAREIFHQIGDVYNRAIADNNLGGIARNQGRLDDALAFYQAALGAMERLGRSRYVQAILHDNLGAVHIRRGDARAARRHLRISHDYFVQAQSRDFLPELHRHLAEAALLDGDLAEAEAQGRRALDLARELSMRSEEGNALRALGQIVAARSLDEAEARLQQSIAILDEVGDEYEMARARLFLAQSYESRGSDKEALTALQQCLPVFERLEAAMDLSAAQALAKKIEGKS